MKILSVNSGYNLKAPNFKSCYRSYIAKTASEFKDFDKHVVWTSTNIFREDLDWAGLVKYLISHFKGKEKVNSYSMACSDGSEAYSYVISLMENIPKPLCSKFFPVLSSDLDEEVINKAKLRKINIEDCEIYFINKTGINLDNYFKNRGEPLIIQNDLNTNEKVLGLYSYEPVDELKQAVEFKQSDILSELNKIKDDGNSVVMCRNVMPYLSDEYINKIVNTSSKVLKDGSLFITGDYDYQRKIDEKLLTNGFYRPLINNRNVFQKGNKTEVTDKLLSGYLI